MRYPPSTRIQLLKNMYLLQYTGWQCERVSTVTFCARARSSVRENVRSFSGNSDLWWCRFSHLDAREPGNSSIGRVNGSDGLSKVSVGLTYPRQTGKIPGVKRSLNIYTSPPPTTVRLSITFHERNGYRNGTATPNRELWPPQDGFRLRDFFFRSSRIYRLGRRVLRVGVNNRSLSDAV